MKRSRWDNESFCKFIFTSRNGRVSNIYIRIFFLIRTFFIVYHNFPLIKWNEVWLKYDERLRSISMHIDVSRKRLLYIFSTLFFIRHYKSFVIGFAAYLFHYALLEYTLRYTFFPPSGRFVRIRIPALRGTVFTDGSSSFPRGFHPPCSA